MTRLIKFPACGWAPGTSDYRIEQLIDKIIDNAIDFQTKGTNISVQLTTLRDKVQIVVRNYGPVLPKHLENNLFASMVSERPDGQDSRTVPVCRSRYPCRV